MMELVPEKIDNGVVFTARQACPMDEEHCQLCSDYAVGIHNWLIAHEIPYVIIDLCDEKDVCPELIIELLQLRKRLRCPFYFSGVMERPRGILQAHAYLPEGRIFTTPEDAVAELTKLYPHMTQKSLDGIQFGQPLAVSRPRQGVRGDSSIEGSEESPEAEMDEA